MEVLEELTKDEVLASAKKIHETYRESFAWTRDVITNRMEARSTRNWYRCKFRPDEIPEMLLGPHHHPPEKIELVPVGGPVRDAVEVFRTTNYALENRECYDRIITLLQLFNENASMPPIFVYEENRLLHCFDGVHRTIAWCLGERTRTMDGIIGRQ